MSGGAETPSFSEGLLVGNTESCYSKKNLETANSRKFQ